MYKDAYLTDSPWKDVEHSSLLPYSSSYLFFFFNTLLHTHMDVHVHILNAFAYLYVPIKYFANTCNTLLKTIP